MKYTGIYFVFKKNTIEQIENFLAKRVVEKEWTLENFWKLYKPLHKNVWMDHNDIKIFKDKEKWILAYAYDLESGAEQEKQNKNEDWIKKEKESFTYSQGLKSYIKDAFGLEVNEYHKGSLIAPVSEDEDWVMDTKEIIDISHLPAYEIMWKPMKDSPNLK